MTRHYQPRDADELREIILGNPKTTVYITGEIAGANRTQGIAAYYNTARAAAQFGRGELEEVDVVLAARTTDRGFGQLLSAIIQAEERARFR